MPTRAVVLGGGGPVGIAWESGIAAGLAEEGVDLSEADLFIGTSAGSVVGAQLALGRPPRELPGVDLALGGPQTAAGRAQPQIDITGLIERFTKLFTSDRPQEELRAEVGTFALEAKTMSEEEWLATFGRLEEMGADAWPERRFICTAVDTADGSFAAWDNESGVALGRAVASSCAVPGIFPPVSINGRRYMDGGLRSATNADLASGYDTIVLIALMPGASTMGPPGMLERFRLRLQGEIDGLRVRGSAVELVQPDEASQAAFGMNLMDFTRRGPAAEAGIRQGRLEAARLRDLWG